ncbi:MAG: hypothetical protein IJ160_02330 [Muribaculaceae bacterium]|nr:hypothetical protein [Muribaculaceae bacterium]
MIITCCNIEANWNAISAISNIVLAIIAIATLAFSIFLMIKQNEQRKDDVRARLMFSFYHWKDLFFLKIENIGKEPAFDINLKVFGKPISDSLYENIIKTFSELASKKFSLPAGKSKYFLISPAVTKGADMGIGNDHHSSQEVNDWLEQYGNEPIFIKGKYNGIFDVDETMSIKEHIVFGSFCVYEQTDWIAESLSEMSNNMEKVQKHIKTISENIKAIKARNNG